MIKRADERIMTEYVCRTGCGHVTLSEVDAKRKTVYCSNCGEKTEMEKKGKRHVSSTITLAGIDN